MLTTFDNATVTLDKHTVKSLSGGAKSYRFPKTWKASAEYHTPGQEMLGNDFDTSELTINVDDILVSHYAIADLDRILSHFHVSFNHFCGNGKSACKSVRSECVQTTNPRAQLLELQLVHSQAVIILLTRLWYNCGCL